MLTGAFGAARSGRAGAVLVAGDGGVGKTRLVEELARHARRDGAVVLTGSAVDIADAPPFWPVLSAIRNAARADADTDVATLLRQWLTRLPQAGPDAGPPVVLLDLLHQLVVDLAERRPVLLVVDDLQWADRSTRDLVAYLVANLVREPVLVLVTFRTDSPRRTPDLDVALAELRRLRKVTTLDVAPLPRDVLAALVADWAPDRPELPALVWQRSAGNAFIAEETVRAVLGGDAHGLPSTLREIVLSRIALLSPPAQQVVRALATGVGPLRHRLLADVLDLEPATLLAAVREAMVHGVMRVDDSGEGYLLRHGLLAEVVAADLLPGERIELHRRTALALGRDGDPHDAGAAARLAHHWYEADDPARALQAAAAAARASQAVHAHAEAYRHWLRAAELVDRARADTGGLRRADCLDRAARAAALAGDHDQAVALLERLLDDPATGAGLPSALLIARKGGAFLAAGRVGDAERSYRAAAALLPDSGADAERAQVLAGYGATLLHALDFTAARTVALEALELARRAGAHTVEARVLAVLGFSSAFLDDAEAGSAAIDDAVAVAERAGEPEALGEAYLRRAELLTGPLNRLVEGVAYARDGVERMRALGLARTCGVALLTHAANALFRLGRWDEAERVVAQTWELGPTGAAALDVRLARCRITLGRGRLDEAAADLEAVELLSRSTSGPRQRIPLLVLFAALELWRRDPARALRHAEDGLALAEAGAGDIGARPAGVARHPRMGRPRRCRRPGTGSGAGRPAAPALRRAVAARDDDRPGGPRRGRRLHADVHGRDRARRAPLRSRGLGARGRDLGAPPAAVPGGLRPPAPRRGAAGTQPAQHRGRRCTACGGRSRPAPGSAAAPGRRRRPRGAGPRAAHRGRAAPARAPGRAPRWTISPAASSRSSSSSRRASPTGRSAGGSTSARRPSACT